MEFSYLFFPFLDEISYLTFFNRPTLVGCCWVVILNLSSCLLLSIIGEGIFSYCIHIADLMYLWSWSKQKRQGLMNRKFNIRNGFRHRGSNYGKSMISLQCFVFIILFSVHKLVFNRLTSELTKDLLILQSKAAYKRFRHDKKEEWIEPCSAAEIFVVVNNMDLIQTDANQERVDSVVATFTEYLESYKEFKTWKNRTGLGSSEIQVPGYDILKR